MAITINKLSPHIGAEIADIDLNEEQSAETVAEIVQAWHDNLILLFRGQHLDAERQLEVTSWFGTPGKVARPKEFHPKGYEKLPEGIMLISNIRENGEPIGALPDGEMMFHSDTPYREQPDKATTLYAIEIPSTGGNTLFANCYLAAETLPDHVKQKLLGRKAVHVFEYGAVTKSGKFDIRIAYQPHPNRGKSVPIEVLSEDHTKKTITLVNMTQKPSFENGFHSVRKMTLTKGEKVNVRISAKGAKGNVHLDAAQLLPVD